jgi:hypothetical protein
MKEFAAHKGVKVFALICYPTNLSEWLFHQYHMTEKKIDDPPNLKKYRCYTKFGGIDRKTI